MSMTAALLNPAAPQNQQSRVDAVLQAASNRAFNQVLKTFNIETQDAFV